ncbi:hypothetical protein [Loigolactobacillus binensis]|uniref:Uncharacterized protein n=1 Tax=Loigolactobacillus binensis TaxID=2559922 RepID=A0ABW3E958_9LACO|nr:hypothetical protein [Loigolactobacillus binensis]
MLKVVEILVAAMLTPILLGQASVLWINHQTKNSPLIYGKERTHVIAKQTH